MTYAILTAEDLANRWEYARLPDGRTAVVNPKDESLTVLNRPTLNGAESVIALDGTPTVEKWRLMLGDDLRREAIMSDTEKEGYLRNTLGVRVVQTTVAANHYSGRSAISVTPDVDLVLFEGVRLRENIRPALITSKSALREYEENGLSEVVGETEHYGNLKGSNKFARTRVGIVAGSPHYGDDYIKRWSALAGESAQEAYDKDGVRLKGMAQDFGDYGNRILRGMRENEVLQAILRFGRDGGGATVYVHTAALPEWVERDGVVPEIRPWPPGMYQILDAIRETGDREWRTSDITSRVSVSEQQVREHLHTLAEFGFVSYRREGRGYTWSDESLAEIGQRGHVRFSD
jgi:DNA-binding transcriptional ArsR family regulator